jgi:hypothetical protein
MMDSISILKSIYNLTRRMKTILLLLVLLVAALAQPTCLLKEPLTDDCIQSIDLSMVEQELTKYLCTISYQRKLYQKAE